MKCIYRILRLFFCPHKHVIISKIDVNCEYANGTKTGIVKYRTQCKYCGKLKVWGN